MLALLVFDASFTNQALWILHFSLNPRFNTPCVLYLLYVILFLAGRAEDLLNECSNLWRYHTILPENVVLDKNRLNLDVFY